MFRVYVCVHANHGRRRRLGASRSSSSSSTTLHATATIEPTHQHFYINIPQFFRHALHLYVRIRFRVGQLSLSDNVLSTVTGLGAFVNVQFI